MKIAQKGIHKAKVLLKAQNTFRNFTQRITPKDHIFFGGILSAVEFSLVTDEAHTQVEITEIGCLDCYDKNLKPFSVKRKMDMENQMKDLRRALKYLLNTLFNPLIKFNS